MIPDDQVKAATQDITTEQLREEIRRRQKIEAEGRRPIKPCDECLHFRAWKKDLKPPDTFNPCALGHQMSFRTPDANSYGDGENWGHHRPGCRNRTRRKPLPDFPPECEPPLHPHPDFNPKIFKP